MAIGNEFWADKVRRLKRAGKNREIVALCHEHLPLPAAFSEMAIALRKQIREKRKDKAPHNDLIRKLYHTAVWGNYFADIDACSLAEQEDSCRVAGQSIPRIKCDYSLIGYELLDMLGVNDVKWIVAAWGEPKNHNLARTINLELYEQTVARYKLEKEREQRTAGRLFGGQQLKLADSQSGIDQEDKTEPGQNEAPLQSASRPGHEKGWPLKLIGAITLVVLIVVLFLAL